MEEVQNRLRRLREAAGLTQAALAHAAGVSQGTIGNIESGYRGYGKSLVDIARALHVAPEYLRGEADSPIAADVNPPPHIDLSPRHVISARDEAVLTPYLPGFEKLSIPVLAQSGSMGVGEDQLHDEVVVGRLTVSPQWVARTIKPLTKLENLRFIHGYGDSMDPTFADGDILLVDAGVNDPKIDGVYVLEANDRIYIKRVRQRIDGTFEISSDNPNVKTVDVLDGSNQVAVRGRVVWCWNGKKM